MHKRTKIVATLGPACEKQTMIVQMVNAGMNVARLNFSHGSHDNHQLLINRVRRAEKKTGEPVAILQDLQGPKIRVGVLPEKGITLKEGERVIFDTAAKEYKNGIIPVDYSALHKHVQKGERLLLNDGRVETVIASVKGTRITVIVKNTGVITSHKGLNIPDSHLAVSALTAKDKADARFGVGAGVDMIALSFVTSEKDVMALKRLITRYEKELGKTREHSIQIIAKIERGLAIQHIDGILNVVDGIMVARGDLGIEMPAAEVPLIQKTLIALALKHAKPVIVATQMLDSMQDNPRPTRAEVSDVANAVIDHADAVMLSNETATGTYPVETVRIMAEIIEKTEQSAYDNMPPADFGDKEHPVDDILSDVSKIIAEDVRASLILAASGSGETGRFISRNRPELPIAIAAASDRVRRQLNLSWGVVPFLLSPSKTIDAFVARSVAFLKKKKILKKGETIVIVADDAADHASVLEVRKV